MNRIGKSAGNQSSIWNK